jgi:hypothetical protein
VQRHCTGTAGRIENAQVAVYLTYAGARGHAMIDRELYLPRCWTDDPDRLTDAGVPEDIDFATKTALAAGMLARVLRAGVPARWVVLTIGRDRRVPAAAGPIRADALAAGLPKRAWQRLSAELGAKGHRHYDWGVDAPRLRPHHRRGRHRVLVAAGPPQPHHRGDGVIGWVGGAPFKPRWLVSRGPSAAGLPGVGPRARSACRGRRYLTPPGPGRRLATARTTARSIERPRWARPERGRTGERWCRVPA